MGRTQDEIPLSTGAGLVSVLLNHGGSGVRRLKTVGV